MLTAEQLDELTSGTTEGEVAKAASILKLMDDYQKTLDNAGIHKWFIPNGPYPIEKCPKHKLFFDATAKYNELLFCAGNRCLEEGTLVATPKGPVPIEDLKAGDYVYDKNGELTKVLDVYDNGIKPVVDLYNRNKFWAAATPDHEFETYIYDRKDQISHIDNTEASKLGEKAKVRRVFVKAPLGDVSFPLAYALGAFLGDGCSTARSKTSLELSSADARVPLRVAGLLGAEVKAPHANNCTWRIKSAGFEAYDNYCRGRYAHDKFVDLAFIKTLNRESALEFMAGLLDTDGSLSLSTDGLTLTLNMQAESVVDAWDYLMLALWQVMPTRRVDNRSKYVNGPVHSSIVRNPYDIERIVEELSSYSVIPKKTSLPEIKNYGKRSYKDSIMLKPSDTIREAHTYDITVEHPEHLYLLANGLVTHNTGKTLSGAYVMACHLTGEYPSFWSGRRWSRPISAWAAGSDAKSTRDTVQKELLGPIGAWGSGMIPLDKMGKFWMLSGVPQGVDTIEVKHISGGMSTLSFKNYQQASSAYYGTEKHCIWLDEIAPASIYNECLIRTMTVEGDVMVTFTPLEGLTPLVVNFFAKADLLGGSKPLVGVSAETIEGQEENEARLVNRKTSKAIITAGWDDAPWLGDEVKERMLDDTPPHLKNARSKGEPSMGAGNIYPIPLDEVLIPPFEIPDYYERICGFDIGWNATAAVWLAVNPDTGVAILYDEYLKGGVEPVVHAAALRSRGEWMNIMIDPAARGRSQVDGQKLMEIYRAEKLNIYPAKNEVEAGILSVWGALSTGKLKVFNNLYAFQREYALYRRDLNGKVIKENDHILDATRYAYTSLRRALSKREATSYDTGAFKNISLKYDV